MDSVWDQLRCDWCGAAIAASHIDRERNHAFCPFCEGLTHLTPDSAASTPLPPEETFVADDTEHTPTEPDQPDTPLRLTPPTGTPTTLFEYPDRLEIHYRRASSQIRSLLFATVVFAVFQGVLLARFGLFISPLFWLTILAGYYALARIVNTSRIEVKPGTISFHSKPLPWFANRVIHNPQQLWVRRVPENPLQGETWMLMVTNERGTHQRLMANGQDLHEVRWMEHRIEHYLGITDRPVAGEVEKTNVQ